MWQDNIKDWTRLSVDDLLASTPDASHSGQDPMAVVEASVSIPGDFIGPRTDDDDDDDNDDDDKRIWLAMGGDVIQLVLLRVVIRVGETGWSKF